MIPSTHLRGAGRALLCVLLLTLGPSSIATNPPIPDVVMERIDQTIARAHIDKTAPEWRLPLPKPDKVPFDPTHTYYVRMETSAGTLLVQLKPAMAPEHVISLLYLSRLGFYDGMSFLRVTPALAELGVDASDLRSRGPGYRLPGKFRQTLGPGCLSMPIEGPGKDGHQLVLSFRSAPWLDDQYLVLGQVIEGLDSLQVLADAALHDGIPRGPVKLIRMTPEVR
jgi:peptidyl-prolyl cis-trans isomerase B (cyclophilin B)